LLPVSEGGQGLANLVPGPTTDFDPPLQDVRGSGRPEQAAHRLVAHLLLQREDELVLAREERCGRAFGPGLAGRAPIYPATGTGLGGSLAFSRHINIFASDGGGVNHRHRLSKGRAYFFAAPRRP